MKMKYLICLGVTLGICANAMAQSSLFELRPGARPDELSGEAVQAANLVLYRPIRDCIESAEKSKKGHFKISSIRKISDGSEVIYEIDGATLIGGDASTGSFTIEVSKTSQGPVAVLSCRLK